MSRSGRGLRANCASPPVGIFTLPRRSAYSVEQSKGSISETRLERQQHVMNFTKVQGIHLPPSM